MSQYERAHIEALTKLTRKIDSFEGMFFLVAIVYFIYWW